MIVSDPAIAKHVLRNYGTKYAKGLVAEVSEFLFGSGFAIAEGSLWTVLEKDPNFFWFLDEISWFLLIIWTVGLDLIHAYICRI